MQFCVRLEWALALMTTKILISSSSFSSSSIINNNKKKKMMCKIGFNNKICFFNVF